MPGSGNHHLLGNGDGDIGLCRGIAPEIKSLGRRARASNFISKSKGRNAMEMESLKDLFVDELKDLYSAENQILKALPKMIKKASSKELKSGFEQHLKETQVHVERLEKIF